MNISQKWLVRLSFGLFIGWTMSFPYEGPLLYALADFLNFDGGVFNSISVFLVSAGMLCGALTIRSWMTAKKIMSASVLISLVGVALVMFLPNKLILYDLILLAFLSGLFVPAWGYTYYYNTPAIERGKAVADVLIIGNIALTVTAVLANFTAPLMGMLLCILILIATLFVCLKLEIKSEDLESTDSTGLTHLKSNFRIPFVLFVGFIFLISITSGIMFSVVYPYFSSFELLSSLYTNFPYMLALLILRSMSQKRNKNFTLYVGMSILGLSYMLFAFMPDGISKFFFVMTPMLAAYGIFDYFWWRIMGDLCSYGYNPSFVVGISLAVNVFGVFCGGLLSINVMEAYGLAPPHMAFFVLGVAFIIIALLPLLNSHMSTLLSNHIFFIQYAPLAHLEKVAILEDHHTSELLTERESEIVNLVLSGMTVKTISETLFISDNTAKTHVKNIYKKLNINSKYELIKMFSKT